MASGTREFKLPQYGATPKPTGSPIRSMYDAAAQTQAGDYDNIMAGYDSLQSKASNASNGPDKLNYVPVNSVKTSYVPGAGYSRSNDLNNLVGNLQEYSSTGGYSGDDISSIRERALSPIRATYANAQRNLNRQKTLQGGYMPNAGAIYSKMAREQGELASSASTNVNAEVAKMIAAGKLAGYQSLSPILSNENTMQNNINSNNANALRETEMFNTADEQRVRDLNANMRMRVEEMNADDDRLNNNLELSALSGKANLYGTTPALTNTFGNQVLENNQQNMQAVQTANAIKNQRAGIGLNIIGAAQSAPKSSSGTRGWTGAY